MLPEVVTIFLLYNPKPSDDSGTNTSEQKPQWLQRDNGLYLSKQCPLLQVFSPRHSDKDGKMVGLHHTETTQPWGH